MLHFIVLVRNEINQTCKTMQPMYQKEMPLGNWPVRWDIFLDRFVVFVVLENDDDYKYGST